MSTRYLSNLALVIGGGFLVVATQAFPVATVAWLAFAVAVGLTTISLYMLVGRGAIPQRTAGAVGLILGVWTIVASLVFAPTTVLWLGFASAIAFVVLGLIGLTVHELTTERVVHSLETGSEQRAPRQTRANGKTVVA